MLRTMPVASGKAITEPVLLGSITTPLGFLVNKLGTTVALPVPKGKEEYAGKGLQSVRVTKQYTMRCFCYCSHEGD